MRLVLSLLLLVSLTTCKQYDWTNVEDKINYYQMNGAFKGGVLKVANGTHNIYTKAFGHFTN